MATASAGMKPVSSTHKNQLQKSPSMKQLRHNSALMASLIKRREDQTQQKHLEQLDDYHKMKEYYYERYMSQLRDKIKEHDDAINSREQQLKERADRNARIKTPVKKKKVVKDKPTPMAIPKSQRYNLVEAEDNLIKAGYLKPNDTENLLKFRREAQNTDDLDSFLVDFMRYNPIQQSSHKSRRASGRPLSQISEARSRESSAAKSRPITRELQKRPNNINLNPMAGNPNLTPAEIAKAAANALDKKCPRMDIPYLYCLQPAEVENDNSLEEEVDKYRKKVSGENQAHVSYLREMYQRSQANTAQAKRIIDSRDDDPLQAKSLNNRIADMTSYIADSSSFYGYDDYEDDQSSRDDVEPADLSDTETTDHMTSHMLSRQEEERISRWREGSDMTSRIPINRFTPIQEEEGIESPHIPPASQSKLLAIENTNKEQRRDPLPLALTEMATEIKIMESKAPSTFWQNYLHVGKSKFAKDE